MLQAQKKETDKEAYSKLTEFVHNELKICFLGMAVLRAYSHCRWKKEADHIRHPHNMWHTYYKNHWKRNLNTYKNSKVLYLWVLMRHCHSATALYWPQSQMERMVLLRSSKVYRCKLWTTLSCFLLSCYLPKWR